MSGGRHRHGHQDRTFAIRREDNTVWERRAPLAPNHIRELVKKGIKVIVQPSNRRAFSMTEFINAGAVVQEDISEAPLVLGVKSVPIDLLMPDKTYAFFSHTIKAQKANMPLLDAILEKNIRLIDYEKMTDDSGRRSVAFGKYAGVSGMINILHGLGLRLLALGNHTPFMYIGPSHNYRNTELARQAIREAGYQIALDMMPKSIGPLVFVFTGSGNVSEGAQEVFRELPYEYIEPRHLPKIVRKGTTNKVYGCVVNRDDHLSRRNGGGFDANEFENHPEKYASDFARKIAPYATCIVNGIYYAPNDPRLISIADCKQLLQPQDSPWIPSSAGCPHLPHRLLALCDISADPGGSIEFMKECTTIDKPFCLYDAEQNMNTESFSGNGILICSIDNMPAQIPREATEYFGSLLLPHVEHMLKCDATRPFEELQTSRVVKDAIIASNGKLTPKYEYIAALRKERERSLVLSAPGSSRKSVLILGAGYVSAPCVDYLVNNGCKATVVSQYQDEADNLAKRFPHTSAILLSVDKKLPETEKLIKEHDIVVSLLPYSFHPSIAEMCIRNKKDLVTASYLSPAMRDLHQAASEAGVTVMNEVGLDPGIDHLLAMECFQNLEQHGGKVTSFVSWCGGLPAPQFTDNELRYRFSWSPRGVLLNLRSGATFRRDGKVVHIPEGGALMDSTEQLNFLPGFNFEGFPNRNSLSYEALYGIQNAHTVLRGTVRYKGFADAAKGLVQLGLTSPEPLASLHPSGPPITWKQLLSELLGKNRNILTDSVRDLVFDKVDRRDSRLRCVEELGLLSDEEIDKRLTPLDTISNYMAKRLAFGPDEYDMVVLRHDIGVRWPDSTEDTYHIDLVAYGSPNGGYSAMAKTVGYPVGIACKLILDGEVQRKGMLMPLSPDVYRPMLRHLRQLGIRGREHVARKHS